MDELRNPWEQFPDEPSRWFHRFEHFRLLPDRSVLAAFNQWRLAKSREVSRSAPLSWRESAKQWHWQERAAAWDRHCVEQAAAAIEAQRIEIMSSGYALQHKRVEGLNKLAGLLLDEIKETDKRWLPDVKSIGSGDFAVRVDLVRFNGTLVEQARKTLDDIAREVGERVQKQDITSGGKPLEKLTNDELIKLLTGLNRTGAPEADSDGGARTIPPEGNDAPTDR